MHFDVWTLALQTLNFAILVWLLHRFLYKPVLRVIDAREAAVKRQFDDAAAVKSKADEMLKAVDADRAGIVAEREAALAAAAKQAQELTDALNRRAEAKAQALLEDGRKTLAAERDQVLKEAQHTALDLGAAFAQRLLAEMPVPLRAEVWLQRIEDHVKALAPEERDALARQLADGQTLSVVTATSLPPASAEKWRDSLKSLLGGDIGIAFKADPKLLAGAELHFPTSILRFSWQDVLTSAQAEVMPRADAH